MTRSAFARVLIPVLLLANLLVQLSPVWCPMQSGATHEHHQSAAASHHEHGQTNTQYAPTDDDSPSPADCWMAFTCGLTFMNGITESAFISANSQAAAPALGGQLHTDADVTSTTPPPRA